MLREQAPPPRRDASEAATRREGPLARWLRARWSPRTRELLAFIRRREYPEDVGRRLRPLLIVLAIALAWSASTYALLGICGIVVFLAFQLIRDLGHMPSGRGNHDHPLMETWPVSAREFIHVTLANDFATLASTLA